METILKQSLALETILKATVSDITVRAYSAHGCGHNRYGSRDIVNRLALQLEFSNLTPENSHLYVKVTSKEKAVVIKLQDDHVDVSVPSCLPLSTPRLYLPVYDSHPGCLALRAA